MLTEMPHDRTTRRPGARGSGKQRPVRVETMTTPDPTPPVWQDRADEAARSVTSHFGRKLLFLPRTHLGAVQWDGSPTPGPAAFLAGPAASVARPWHYWWQAHYVDCLVDAGLREFRNGGKPARF